MADGWAVSPYNFAPEVRDGMRLPASVQITDLTLREGRQVGGVWITLDDVREYARRAAHAGISVLEMHHSDPDEIHAVKALELGLQVQALVHPTAALSPERCRAEIDACLEVGTDVLSLALAVSDHNHGLVRAMAGLDVSREQIVENTCEALRYGRSQGATVGVILMDFTRLELSRLTAICADVAAAGAQHVRLDDICAPCAPSVYRHHTQAVKEAVGDVAVAMHSHDDFDLALAGQLAALEGGAEILEASVNGLGERAGLPNIAAMASVLKLMYGYDTGIRLEELQGLSEFVAETWNQPIPPHMAVVGDTAFSHAVEVHYVMDEGISEWAWNAWRPEVVGNRSYVPLCKYSGSHAIRAKARGLGLSELSPEQSRQVVELVRSELEGLRHDLDDETFARLVATVLGEQPGAATAKPSLLDPADDPGRVPPDHYDSVSRVVADLRARGRASIHACEMQPGGRATAHRHPGADQVLFVIDGEVAVGDADGPRFRVAAGQAALMPADVPHTVANDGTTAARYLAVTLETGGG